MGRRKRSRKIRSANRRAKRLEKTLRRAQALVDEQRHRAEARKAINESDLPPEVKKAAGFLVDPLGAMHELVVEEVLKKVGQAPPEEEEVPPWLKDE